MKKSAKIKIEAFGDKGVAVGRLDGKAFFVRFAAPGDLLEVEITEEKRGWARGELTRILEPSPLRVEPLCEHFYECGGCAWQHVGHAAEIAGKAASLEGFFKNRLKLAESVFLPPVESPKSYGYRNRLTLSASRGAMGLSGLKSHRLVEIKTCPVATPALNAALPKLREAAKNRVLPAAARILLQEDSENRVWCTLTTDHSLGSALKANLRDWAAASGFAGVWHGSEGTRAAPLTGTESDLMSFNVQAGQRALRLAIPVGAFTQANPEVSQGLVDLLLDHRELFEGKETHDFYCGSGNFTLPLALYAGKVTGVEGDTRAADAARKNCQSEGIANAAIVAKSVEAGLGEEAERSAFWLLDPPRTGSQFLAQASKDGPPAIFYISCDPPSMARDLGIMRENGYGVEWVRGADMFPRTAHLEVAALLTRRF